MNMLTMIQVSAVLFGGTAIRAVGRFHADNVFCIKLFDGFVVTTFAAERDEFVGDCGNV